MPEPRPDLAAIRRRLFAGSKDQAWADCAALVARVEELEAALWAILKVPSSRGWRDSFAIARKALAAAQEEPTHE